MGYARRFFRILCKDSVPWARDNILVSSVMAIVPTLAVFVRDHKHAIDWSVIWSALCLYGASFILYALFHGCRTIWKLDREHLNRIKCLEATLANHVVITDLRENDPRIEPLFVDGRKHPLGGHEHFELKNKGAGAAYAVRIAPLRLTKSVVHFPDLVEKIEPTDFRVFHGEIRHSIYNPHPMFIKAFNEEWAAREDSSAWRDVLIPARIDFEDKDGVRFECNFTILYHGGRGYNQPADFKCVECLDISYRRIPKGVTPPESASCIPTREPQAV